LEEVAPPEFSGTVGGIMNSIGAIAGILSPAITGILVSMTGNFQLSLLIGGGMVLFAALTVLFIIPDLKPISLEDGSV
jgi:MFS family permease